MAVRLPMSLEGLAVPEPLWTLRSLRTLNVPFDKGFIVVAGRAVTYQAHHPVSGIDAGVEYARGAGGHPRHQHHQHSANYKKHANNTGSVNKCVAHVIFLLRALRLC